MSRKSGSVSFSEVLRPSADDIYLGFADWFSMWCDDRSQSRENFNVDAMKAAFELFVEMDAEQPWGSFKQAAQLKNTTFMARAFQLIDEFAMQGEYNKLMLKKPGEISPRANTPEPNNHDAAPVPAVVVAPAAAALVVAQSSAPVAAVVASPVVSSPSIVASAPAAPPASEAATFKPVFSDALAYLNGVKKRFAADTHEYRTFLRILADFKSQKLSQVEVEIQVKLLFAHEKDLLEGFQLFLPQKKAKEPSAAAAAPLAAPLGSLAPFAAVSSAPVSSASSSPSTVDASRSFRVAAIASKHADMNHCFMNPDRLIRLNLYNGDAAVISKGNREIVVLVYSDNAVNEEEIALSEDVRLQLNFKLQEKLTLLPLHNLPRIQSVTLKPLYDAQLNDEPAASLADIQSQLLAPFFQVNYYPVSVGSTVFVPRNAGNQLPMRFRVLDITYRAEVSKGDFQGKYGMICSISQLICTPIETLPESKQRLSVDLVSPFVPANIKNVHILFNNNDDTEGMYSSHLLNYNARGVLQDGILQILETNDESCYWLFRYNIVGGVAQAAQAPQYFTHDFEGKNNCKAEFVALYFQYTGNQWFERSSFVPKPNKHWPIELNSSMEEKHVAAKNVRAASVASLPVLPSLFPPEHEMAAPAFPPSHQPGSVFASVGDFPLFPAQRPSVPVNIVDAFSPPWVVHRDEAGVPMSCTLVGNSPLTACKYKVLQLIKKPLKWVPSDRRSVSGRYIFALWSQEGIKEPDASHVAAPYVLTTFPSCFLEFDQEAIDSFRVYFNSNTGRRWEDRLKSEPFCFSDEYEEMERAEWKLAPSGTPLVLINMAGKDSCVDLPSAEMIQASPLFSKKNQQKYKNIVSNVNASNSSPFSQFIAYRHRGNGRIAQPSSSNFDSPVPVPFFGNGGVGQPVGRFAHPDFVPDFPPYSPADFEKADQVAAGFKKPSNSNSNSSNNSNSNANANVSPSAVDHAHLNLPIIPGGASIHPALVAFQREFEESQSKAASADGKLQALTVKHQELNEDHIKLKREFESLRAENAAFRMLMKNNKEEGASVEAAATVASSNSVSLPNYGVAELETKIQALKHTLEDVLENDQLSRLRTELKLMTEKYENLIWTVQVEASLKARNLKKKDDECAQCQSRARLEKMEQAVREAQAAAVANNDSASSSSSSSSESTASSSNSTTVTNENGVTVTTATSSSSAIAASSSTSSVSVATTPVAAADSSSSSSSTAPVVTGDLGVVTEAESASIIGEDDEEDVAASLNDSTTLGEAASIILAAQGSDNPGWEDDSDDEWNVNA